VEHDDFFSSPAYATVLSNRGVLLLGQKAKAFVAYLPVPFCLMIRLLFTKGFITDVSLTPFFRVSTSRVVAEEGRANRCPS
jgi:hypothetical protein